jgi:CRISPR/Cas system-associated protein endoribonuclease Cas2
VTADSEIKTGYITVQDSMYESLQKTLDANKATYQTMSTLPTLMAAFVVFALVATII